MVGYSVRICKAHFGKRGGHLGIIHYLLIIVFCGSLLAFLFVDVIELWVTALGMSRLESPQGVVLPHSVPPTRSEEFLLMPSIHVCERAKPYLITLVATAPPNRKARQAIRDTWGGEVHVRGHRVMTLFVVGPNRPGYWKRTNRRVFKRDESELLELYLGRVHMQVAPDRNPASRHFMSETAYAGMVLPDYCSGTAYVLSHSALLKLSLAAVAINLPKPLPPEDVFVEICAHTAGINPTHSPFFSGGPAVPYSRCCYQTMVSVHHTTPANMLNYWTDMHSSGPCSWLGVRTSLGVCKVRALLGTLLRRD
nr:LOW QUALITY PROTEIN: beta-1,3-galactosyltransferase 4-like [Danio rerio]|eukprot:XP_009300606.3 LOW QUALITY PROTEIN: beta-1,3-galactosyltransferase 4-like [Danio rerio]